ncbi:MAG: N-acyl amino acid synthase FeeM domain-containing protein [Frankiaceae bacterium]
MDTVDDTVDLGSLWFGLADDPALVAAARRLQGRVYLDRGFVGELRDGMVDDPYVPHARYFVAAAPGGQVVGVCRQILGPLVELPTLTRFRLHPPYRAWADAVNAGDVVELSALAVDRSLVAASGRMVSAGLYRQMWQRAFTRHEHRYWVANVSPRLLDVLNGAFGFGFEPMGDAQPYVGPPTVPCRLELDTLPARLLRTHPDVAAWFLDGMPQPAVIDLTAGLAVPAQVAAVRLDPGSVVHAP